MSFYIYFTFLPLKSRRHKKKWKEEKEIGGEKIKKERKKREREREIKGEEEERSGDHWSRDNPWITRSNGAPYSFSSLFNRTNE